MIKYYSNNKFKVHESFLKTRGHQKKKVCCSSYKAFHMVCKIHLKGGRRKCPKTEQGVGVVNFIHTTKGLSVSVPAGFLSGA